MTKILFVCTANVDRSPTAEKIYSKYEGFQVDSAGIAYYATTPINEKLIQWADVILCMEERHKKSIENGFSNILDNKIIDYLNIPDNYEYMDYTLQRIIKDKTDAWLIKHNFLKPE